MTGGKQRKPVTEEK